MSSLRGVDVWSSTWKEWLLQCTARARLEGVCIAARQVEDVLIAVGPNDLIRPTSELLQRLRLAGPPNPLDPELRRIQDALEEVSRRTSNRGASHEESSEMNYAEAVLRAVDAFTTAGSITPSEAFYGAVDLHRSTLRLDPLFDVAASTPKRDALPFQIILRDIWWAIVTDPKHREQGFEHQMALAAEFAQHYKSNVLQRFRPDDRSR